MTFVLLGAFIKYVKCGYECGCAGQTRKHTLGCTADIWDQLLLGCAGGACGSVDLQLLDLTPDRVCSGAALPQELGVMTHHFSRQRGTGNIIWE